MNLIKTSERVTDFFVPLLLIATVLPLRGHGFGTNAPVVACVLFSVVQPFIRIFLFDKVRGPLLRAGRHVELLLGSLLCYGALALLACRIAA